MGYSITIGTARLVAGVDIKWGEGFYANWEVEDDTDDAAPVFHGDSVTGNTNGRSPSYSAWAKFVEEVGLDKVFFDESEGLMRDHPGTQVLLPKHLKAFEDALKRREENDPRPAGLDPRYNDPLNFGKQFEDATHDYHKVRLLWLLFWTRKALASPLPAIHNS